MTVAVNQPTPKDDDAFTKIARGLSVAQSILGIKQSMDQSALAKKQQEKLSAEEDRRNKGILTPTERIALGTSAMEVSKDTVGAVPGLKTPEGEELYFLPKTAAEIAQKSQLITQKTKDLEEKTAKAKKDGDWKPASDLRNEHFKSSKEAFEAVSGFKKVESAYNSADQNAPNDMAMIFGYMKTLDPGSTVREGEYASAEQARGVPASVLAMYNKAIDGQILTPEQRTQFFKSAARQLSGQLQVQDQTDARFAELAKRAGVDPDLVVDPRFKTQNDEIQKVLGDLNKASMGLSSKSNKGFSGGDSFLPSADAAPAPKKRTGLDAVNSFLSE